MNTICRWSAGGVVLSLVLAGCATTEQARNVTPSPFLGSAAALMTNGGEGTALLRYMNPNVRWTDFQNVLVEPVTYWIGAGENDGLTPQQRQDFVNYMDRQLRKSFSSQSYSTLTLQDTPGAHTLRLAFALINTQHAETVLAATALTAPENAAGAAVTPAGQTSFTGKIHGEIKITHSVTGELYVAAADARTGSKGNASQTIEAASRYWAQQCAYRICMLQSHLDCIPPSP